MIDRKELHARLDQQDSHDRELLREAGAGRTIDAIVRERMEAEARIRPLGGARPGLGRRAVLNGLGASAVLFPFLGPGGWGAGRARAASEYDNLLLITWPCGLEPGWTPTGTGAGYTLSGSGGSGKYLAEPQLQGLVERHRERIVIMSGMNGTISPDLLSHSQGPTSMWTGWTQGGGNTKAIAGLPSVEQKIGAKISAELAFKSLHAGVLVSVRETGPSNIALPYYHYAGANAPLTAIEDPAALYAKLVMEGGLANRSSMMAALGASPDAVMDAVIAKRRSVLDFVKSELGRARGKIGAADVKKLDAHLEHVRGLEKRVTASESGVGAVATCADPGAPDATLSGAGAGNRQNGIALKTLQAELLALAFQCGMTKTATLQFGESDCMYTVPYEGARTALHVAAHSGDAATRYVSARYMLDRLADVLEVFRSKDAGDGKTLLDKTLIVMTSEMAVPAHGPVNTPVIIAGGSAGAFEFRRGQHIAAPGTPQTPNLNVTLLQYFGFPDETFGDGGMGVEPGKIDALLA
jgi:hypothetical protein